MSSRTRGVAVRSTRALAVRRASRCLETQYAGLNRVTPKCSASSTVRSGTRASALADLGGLERLGRRQHDSGRRGRSRRGAPARRLLSGRITGRRRLERALLIGINAISGDDDRRPIERQRHRLIERRLAAGRRHGQRIAPVEERAKARSCSAAAARCQLLSGDRAPASGSVLRCDDAPPSANGSRCPCLRPGSPTYSCRGGHHDRLLDRRRILFEHVTAFPSAASKQTCPRSGRSIPCSWYFSQKCAHGQPVSGPRTR